MLQATKAILEDEVQQVANYQLLVTMIRDTWIIILQCEDFKERGKSDNTKGGMHIFIFTIE